MTTSMYCLYVGFDYTYIDINALVKKWAAEFKSGRDSLEDDSCQRRPLTITITTQKTIAKIHDIVMADRRVMEYNTATELGISASMPSSTTNVICPSCQYVVSQNS